MRGLLILTGMTIILFTVIGCAHHTQDVEKLDFNGHFGDMDIDGDDMVNWEEFKQYFSHADKKIFAEADTNSDGMIDHDEWHHFKEKHSYGHME